MNAINPNDPKTWPVAECQPTDIFLGETTFDYAPHLTAEQRTWPVADCVPSDVCLSSMNEPAPNPLPKALTEDSQESEVIGSGLVIALGLLSPRIKMRIRYARWSGSNNLEVEQSDRSLENYERVDFYSTVQFHTTDGSHVTVTRDNRSPRSHLLRIEIRTPSGERHTHFRPQLVLQQSTDTTSLTIL